MGADPFYEVSTGKDAQDAFTNAVEAAQWDCGHGGYTGTIAEKRCFKVFEVPEGKSPKELMDEIMDEDNEDAPASYEEIWGKHGPAGCVKLDAGKWAFFGWAAS